PRGPGRTGPTARLHHPLHLTDIAQHVGEALLPAVAGARRPEEVLEGAKDHEAEGDTYQAIPRDLGCARAE
ncbi:MAG TPA: hypothetical protein VMG58_06210, partial [Candidatus Sulfotelmatobacter sp.]|nr:hypothetical protein [Candidatus Sulfotelmatobacter sp.]